MPLFYPAAEIHSFHQHPLCFFSVQSATIVILTSVVLGETSAVIKVQRRKRGPQIAWHFTLSETYLYGTNPVPNITKLGETIVFSLFLELGSEHASTSRNKCINKPTREPGSKLGEAGTCQILKITKAFTEYFLQCQTLSNEVTLIPVIL